MAALPGPAAGVGQGVLTLDLGALVYNWKLLGARAPDAECAAVVKANAYGVGLEPAVRALAGAGCKTFFVSQASEGVLVRQTLRRRTPSIYVLNGLPPGPDAARLYVEHNLSPVLGSFSEFVDWSATAMAMDGKLRAALHFDTGMARLGADAAEASAILQAAQAAKSRARVVVDLLLSHFISSEAAEDSTNSAQIARFEALHRGFPDVRASMANSSALFLPQKPLYDMVRPGYALYGGNPTPGAKNPMRPVVRLEAPILQLREIDAGQSVGYNAQWTAKRRTRLATIGVGYADGLPRNLMATDARAGGEAIVAGKRCAFAGRVSMDLIVIDVTDVPAKGLVPGTMAELLGEKISVDDMAKRAGTIGYEILTSLGDRYERVYLQG